jgi:aminoglycoside 6'-N-acetyltransferase
VIRGELTVLRPATPADTDLLVGWHADPEVNRWWYGRPLTREEVDEKYVGRRSPAVESLIVEADGEPVGYIQYAPAEQRPNMGGIDMFLVPASRGRGLASDAVDALVRHLMEEKGWRRVTVDPAATNLHAIGFWFRNGFRPAGMLQTPDGPGLLMIRYRVHPWMHRLRDRKEHHKRRSRLYRASFATAGVLVILAGLALIPLPGPGWLIVAVGVFMLALEFDRAERLLEKILDRLEDVTEQAQKAGPWAKALLALVAVGGVAAVATAFVLWDVPLLPG